MWRDSWLSFVFRLYDWSENMYTSSSRFSPLFLWNILLSVATYDQAWTSHLPIVSEKLQKFLLSCSMKDAKKSRYRMSGSERQFQLRKNILLPSSSFAAYRIDITFKRYIQISNKLLYPYKSTISSQKQYLDLTSFKKNAPWLV